MQQGTFYCTTSRVHTLLFGVCGSNLITRPCHCIHTLHSYEDVKFIAENGLDADDLDAIGVRKLGHRKRLMKLFRIEEVVEAEEEEDEEEDEDEEEVTTLLLD